MRTQSGFPNPLWGLFCTALLAITPVYGTESSTLERRANGVETGQNGSTWVWTIEDVFQGDNFFEQMHFFTGDDPTHGTVNYVDQDTAFNQSLAFVDSNGNVIMKGDDTNWLPPGVNRSSVRVSSIKQYNTGLFILDLNRAPWGCATWPAWWTVGGGQWPYTGEIDIIEGVHDNEHNQVTWHTGPNCTLIPSNNFTGSLVYNGDGQPNLQCDGLNNDNSGCAVVAWSQASYGPSFDAGGGGVFAMKWDEEGIAVWNFYRNAVPLDITAEQPKPSSWGEPVGYLNPLGCDPISNFVNHSIIFDITFCGDWAGNSYATSGCPGTCPDHLMDPSNFVNASWSINHMKVYKKQFLTGVVTSAASHGRLWLVSEALRWMPFVILLACLL